MVIVVFLLNSCRFWKQGYWRNHLGYRPYHIRYIDCDRATKLNCTVKIPKFSKFWIFKLKVQLFFTAVLFMWLISKGSEDWQLETVSVDSIRYEKVNTKMSLLSTVDVIVYIWIQNVINHLYTTCSLTTEQQVKHPY